MTGWLAQSVTMPLWAFITALLLPAAFFAKLAKEAVMKKLGHKE